jgi:UDP-sugar transporter A1/2/3
MKSSGQSTREGASRIDDEHDEMEDAFDRYRLTTVIPKTTSRTAEMQEKSMAALEIDTAPREDGGNATVAPPGDVSHSLSTWVVSVWKRFTHLCIFLTLTFMHAFALLIFKLNAVDGQYPFSPASALVMTESLKFVLATALLTRDLRSAENAPPTSTSVKELLMDSFQRDASWSLIGATTVISGMYSCNNLLSYFCVRKMDPGVLAIAKALVPYLTAVVLQLFGRPVNDLQWACIVLQCTGVATTQFRSGGEGSTTNYSWDMYAFLALSVLITTFSSVFNEQVIKRFRAPLQLINMIMYAVGFFLAAIIYILVPAYHEKALFEGYSPMVLLLIFVQATYGLCVGYAYKYADVLIKNLSTSATLAVLVGLSAILFGAPLSFHSVAGSVVIITTSFIYMKYATKISPPSSGSKGTWAQRMPRLIADLYSGNYWRDLVEAQRLTAEGEPGHHLLCGRLPKVLGLCTLVALPLLWAAVALTTGRGLDLGLGFLESAPQQGDAWFISGSSGNSSMRMPPPPPPPSPSPPPHSLPFSTASLAALPLPPPASRPSPPAHPPPRAPRAPPRAAILLVGAANDMNASTLANFAEKVVAPLQPADVFVLLKGRHFDGSTYSQTEVHELRRLVRHHLRPTSSSIEREDLALQRYLPQSRRAVDCIYPEWSNQYQDSELVTGIYSYWWGAWYLGWQLISAHEQRMDIEYETVVMARADLEYVTPVRNRSTDIDPQVWYSTWEPPDAFWIMPRRVARMVLSTVENTYECALMDDCCNRMAACKQVSWYVPCFWSRHFGLTIEIDTITSFRLHTHHIGYRYSNHRDAGDGQIACAPWKVDDTWRPWGDDVECSDNDMPCSAEADIPEMDGCHS